MRVTCTNCGGAHTPWDCKRPAKKSTAPIESRARRSRSANESLPVDTNSAVEENEVVSFPSQPYLSPTSAGTVGNEDRQPIQKRPRGRPKSITDMASYKAAKQREYRAKWKGRE